MNQEKTIAPEEQAARSARYQQYIDDKTVKARQALDALKNCTQEQVDLLTRACAKTVYDHAEELARDAVAETGLGVVEDKITKNRNKAKLIWWSLRDKKSVGIIAREQGMVKIANPVGVVGAITPMTNPIITPMSNAMFAIKGRNPIIFAMHSQAMNCGRKTINYINQSLSKLGAPEHTIQMLDTASRELTQMLTKAVDVVIATGGMDMVRAVYSSGKPALGVGSGNVQVLFDRGVDYARAVPMVIAGRAFDNGIICTGEQSAIVPDEDFAKVMQIFADNQAYMAPGAQRDALRAAVFPGGQMNRELIGQTAAKVAQAAGLSVPEGTKILIVEAAGRDDILGSEKMFPLVAAYRYGAWEEAVAIARANLEKIGKGHSICIHSNNREHVEYAATHIEAARVLVNQVCAASGGGSFQNRLNPTSTLGCGSWGNNSISENLTYYHLLNISRIAYPLPDNKIPTDAEIWG